ncbi:MAG: DUF1848 family protein [Myxococcota bacterium]|nr:DUF1848 family protein [Myxococcota bacterium]
MEPNATKTGRPLILSASRRTDLPGYYPVSCAQRIRTRIARLRTRPLVGVVFWTRHIAPFLPGGPLHQLVAQELKNPVINLTVTGLGSTPIEPGAPPTQDILRDLPGLIEAFHKEPWRIRWRFDPLLKTHTSLKGFQRIARVMSREKIPTCTFSFPAYTSLKGDLTPQFVRAGIPMWAREERFAFLKRMAQIAGALNLTLLSCAQPENTGLSPLIQPAQCIPTDVLERGLPGNGCTTLPKDRSQRTHCRCVESEDIGNYETDKCNGGCVYCYSKAGGPGA